MQSVTGAAHLQQPFQRIAQETQIPHFSIQFPGKTFQIQLMTKVELFETAGMGKLFSTVDWFEETLISNPGFCEISTQNKSALLRRARIFTTATHNAPRLEVCACTQAVNVSLGTGSQFNGSCRIRCVYTSFCGNISYCAYNIHIHIHLYIYIHTYICILYTHMEKWIDGWMDGWIDG